MSLYFYMMINNIGGGFGMENLMRMIHLMKMIHAVTQNQVLKTYLTIIAMQ